MRSCVVQYYILLHCILFHMVLVDEACLGHSPWLMIPHAGGEFHSSAGFGSQIPVVQDGLVRCWMTGKLTNNNASNRSYWLILVIGTEYRWMMVDDHQGMMCIDVSTFRATAEVLETASLSKGFRPCCEAKTIRQRTGCFMTASCPGGPTQLADWCNRSQRWTWEWLIPKQGTPGGSGDCSMVVRPSCLALIGSPNWYLIDPVVRLGASTDHLLLCHVPIIVGYAGHIDIWETCMYT